MLFIINNETFDVKYAYVVLMLHRMQHRLPGENHKKHTLNVIYQMTYHPSLEEIYWKMDNYIEYVLSYRHPQNEVLLWENFYRDYYRDHLNPYYRVRSRWSAEIYERRKIDEDKLNKLWEDWYSKDSFGCKPSLWITGYPKYIIREFRNSLNKKNKFLFDGMIAKKFWK